MPLDPKQQPPYYTPGTNPTPGDTKKEYVFQLKQTGTDAPTPIIIQNTIGNIVWTRDGVGQYTATLTGAFPIAKTNQIQFFGTAITSAGATVGFYRLWRSNDNTFKLFTYDTTPASADISALYGNDTPMAIYKIQIYV